MVNISPIIVCLSQALTWMQVRRSKTADIATWIELVSAVNMGRSEVIDLGHLSTQTGGDAALAADVLQLFEEQTGDVVEMLKQEASMDKRGAIFHRLKGSARGIGAWHLAEMAERGERDPSSQDVLQTFEASLVAVRRDIGALLG